VGWGEELGSCPAGRAGRLHVHEDGFVLGRRFGRSRGHRYADVRQVVDALGIDFAWDRERGSVLSTPHWRPRLTMVDGSTVELRLVGVTTRTSARDFGPSGIRRDSPPSPAGDLVVAMKERIGRAQLPAALATVRGGGTVAFGPFTVDAGGLHHATAGVLAWDRFDELETLTTYSRTLPPTTTGAVCSAYEWVDPAPGTSPAEPQLRRWVSVPLAEVPNVATLELLAAQLEPRPGPGP
jgi:hypothetical protein